MKKTIYLTFISILMIACNSQDEFGLSLETKEVLSGFEELVIDEFDANESVTESEATLVANTMMSTMSGRSESRTVKSVENIDRDGEPLIYIINFADEKGFVILSAKKSYQPVLAYSDRGHYANCDSLGSTLWMDEQLNHVQQADSQPDSIRFFNYVDWNCLMGKKKSVNCASRSSDFYQLHYQACEKWLSEGYQIYSLMDVLNGSYSFDKEMQIFSNYAEFFEHESDLTGRKVKEDSYILVKRRKEVVDPAKELLSTVMNAYWDQGYPYNFYIPEYPDPISGNMVKPYVGCTAVAVGYILAYHGDMQGFNFNHIRRPNDDLFKYEAADFLYYVGRAVGVEYTNHSLSNNTKVKAGLTNMGYSHTEKNYSTVEIINNIRRNLPVYVSGENSNPNKYGHAWVCDGSDYTIYRDECKLALVVEHSDDISDSGYTYPHIIDNTKYDSKLHFNWGWGIRNVGFFMEDFDAPDGNSYSVNKKIIYNIKRK